MLRFCLSHGGRAMAVTLAAALLFPGCDAGRPDGVTGVGPRPRFSATGILGAHEPSGFRTATARRFDALSEAGWIFGGNVSLYRTLTDSTAPQSPPNVGESVFPVGFHGSAAAVTLERSFRTSS